MNSVVAVVENYRPIKFFNQVKDAKEWMKKNMKAGRTYHITVFEVE